MSLWYKFEHRDRLNKPYEIRAIQEKNGIVEHGRTIEEWAEKIGYYKSNAFSSYDIAQILLKWRVIIKLDIVVWVLELIQKQDMLN